MAVHYLSRDEIVRLDGNVYINATIETIDPNTARCQTGTERLTRFDNQRNYDTGTRWLQRA